MSTRYRVAIVGVGGIAAGRHMPALRAHADRAAAFAAEWDVAHTFDHLDGGGRYRPERAEIAR